MILHAELFMVGIGSNVEHVFNPVGAVGDLQFIPVNTVVLEPAIPVEAKSQQINIEPVFSIAVLDHKTCVDQVCTDLLGGRRRSWLGWWSLHEGKGVALRVADPEGSCTVGI